MDNECVWRTDTSRMLNKFSGGRNEHLQFQLRMTELESRTSDVQELRDWLATSINVNPGQIIMTTMQSGRIFVTFMMKRAYIETFLNYIKTDDGQIAASRRRAGTLIKNKAVINIGPTRCWIKKKYEREHTFNLMEYDLTYVLTSLMDKHKGKNEKAKLFQEVDLKFETVENRWERTKDFFGKNYAAIYQKMNKKRLQNM